MNPKIIVIDGKTYTSVNEMPPEVRQKYEQAMRSLGDANSNRIPDAFETTNIFADGDQDGVPDILENLTDGNVGVSSTKIIVDGKEYGGLENLPPEARAKYEEAMGRLDANRNGIPDFAEGIFSTANQNVRSVANTTGETPPRAAPLPARPTITPDTTNGWMLVLGGLFIFALCIAGAGAVWYFFLR